MTTTVFCKLLQKDLPKLGAPPFPGEKGSEIFEHFSEEAWQQWQARQTMLINEKHLNMMDKTHRRYLTEQRDRFLNGEAADEADGFVEVEPNQP